jgi:thiamine biosynthesis lipoprotein
VNNKLITILFLFVAVLSSCITRNSVFEHFTGFIQGSTYSIIYDNCKSISPVDMKLKVEKILHAFDKSLSLYDDSSILSKINRNEHVVPDSFFIGAFNKSELISEMTGGAFDITIAPLVKAWGFGPDEKKNFTEEKRDSLLKLVGYKKVSLINRQLVKSDPRITLDFNAIAQGYSVDVICRFFENLGIKNYLVEIGGEVKARGTKAGSLWKIGIDKPEDNNMSPGQNLQAVLKITNKAISTSGNYRKYYIEDGIKYSHHIDPKTGYTTKNNLLSVTLISDECAMADGTATACLVMGKEATINFLNKNPQFSAYLIYSDDKGNFKTWVSPSLADEISEIGNE